MSAADITNQWPRPFHLALPIPFGLHPIHGILAKTACQETRTSLRVMTQETLEPVESVSLCQAFVIPVSPRTETALFVASRPSSAFLSLCQLGVSCREREEEVQL